MLDAELIALAALVHYDAVQDASARRSGEARPSETRNAWRLDDAGELDDVVVDRPETFRLERMGPSHWWGAVYYRNGSRTTFELYGDRGALVRPRFEHEDAHRPDATADDADDPDQKS